MEEVLTFWQEELSESDWYAGGERLDGLIRARFAGVWQSAREKALLGWLGTPRGALAYLIVTDQLGRNMHRETALAFATDGLAHAAADKVLEHGWDLRIEGPVRQFFYTPFMHGETMADQNRSVALYTSRLPEMPDQALHARAHREVIRKFGRFPTRNAALGRHSTAAEAEYLASGGYRQLVEGLRV